MTSIVYIVISVFLLIAGIAIVLTGIATERKSLKLAGIVIGAIALQYMVVSGILILIERLQ